MPKKSAKTAPTKAATVTLDEAVDNNDDAAALKLLAAGERPTHRTIGKIGPRISEPLLAALTGAGLDLNDEDGAATAWIGMFQLTTAERVAYVKRLVAHGLVLHATHVREILESLHDDIAAEDDDGVKLIELAIEHGLEPDEELVICALDRLPLAALERLVAAGATIPDAAHVKSSAPDAAKKKKWLAARERKTEKPGKPARNPKAKGRIPWAQFARLDGRDLTHAIVCERIVGETGVFPDAPTDSFESGIDDETLPASHDFYPGEKDADYRVHFWMSGERGKTEDYKTHGKAMFDALLVAMTKALGKPTSGKKDKYWEIGERTISLEQAKYTSQRPYMTVSVRTYPTD